jgi:type I restriction enzyme R subunit
LAQSAIGVARTVMIVDRKDLDSQTKNEFGKFASEYNTGLSSGDVTDNTLIIGINNKRELVNNILSKKNNNTIIITTIQKLSYAIRECADSEKNKFEKIKGEHIVFIVDECHRAVSDEEMKKIKKFFPVSTWIGLTGTPIFDENKKQENGTYARTTFDQYGKLLHAYTTKNAMDDKSVLDFQVEYHSLMNEEEEERLYLSKTNIDDYKKMDMLQKEALLNNSDFEKTNYIETMLKKIFRHQSVLEKFKVINGVPTMSGILTTHSIAQAKRIYYKLMELKRSGNLVTGKPLYERRSLNDPDFPRVAITYSIDENQDKANEAQTEIAEIMNEYGTMYDVQYNDVNLYNQNINNRLARKSAQYQKDGGWLDFVIVVDRLLTGFDAPTIQALYIDKELKWHGLLQAFSRTNRVLAGKDIGMIVSFRKPKTMAKNVRDAFELFSNEEKDWVNLVPRQYEEVRQNFDAAHKDYQKSKKQLEKDPNNLTKRINIIKTFQALKKYGDAIKSYEKFEEDFNELSDKVNLITADFGHIENEKAAVKEILAGQGIGKGEIDEALSIEFSADQRATLEETIDSYYINQLLQDIKNENNKNKFDEIIKGKPDIVKMVYKEIINGMEAKEKTPMYIDHHFRDAIDKIIRETAFVLKVSENYLQTSFNEYNNDKGNVPYLDTIIKDSSHTKESFEQTFPGEKFRRKIVVIEDYWKNVIEKNLLPLKKEMG